jgi:pimeloyl-ACP methyl ester carboxylesterase
VSTTAEQLTVPANGLTFGALAWGDPDAPLALLVHGYPDTAHTWRHLGPHLAANGFRAVAPFPRGYAPTSLAPGDRYRVGDQADDLIALHAALGGDDRAVLIGHDWGAAATWAVTEKQPQRFARYVAMAVPPGPSLMLPWRSPRTLPTALRQLRMSWYMGFQQIPGTERTLERLIPKLWRDWSPGYDAAEDVAHVLRALDTPERRRAALRYYRNSLQGGLKDTMTTGAGAPALYLHGADDGCLQVRLGELYAPHFPAGSRFEVVAGAGHFLQLEQPEAVNALVTEWVTG